VEIDVGRVEPVGIGSQGAAHPVAAGGDHQPVRGLHRPAPRDEFAGQPVKQLGVAWFLPHDAEVVDCPHQPLAKMVLPEPVDQDARQERIGAGIDHAPGQLEPAAALGDSRLVRASQDFEKPPRYECARIAVTASISRLFSGRPGTTAGPVKPPASAP